MSALYLHEPRLRDAAQTLAACPALEHEVRWGHSNGVLTVAPALSFDWLSPGQQAAWRVMESLVHGNLREVADRCDADTCAAVAAAVTALLVPTTEAAA